MSYISKCISQRICQRLVSWNALRRDKGTENYHRLCQDKGKYIEWYIPLFLTQGFGIGEGQQETFFVLTLVDQVEKWLRSNLASELSNGSPANASRFESEPAAF